MRIKNAILVLLLLYNTRAIWAQVTIGGITYQLEHSAAKVIRIDESALYKDALFVPAFIEHEGKVYGVTELGRDACNFCESMSLVVLPDGLVKIDSFAFAGCRYLKTAIMPQSLSEIGYGAFKGCKSLTSIYLPDGLQKIGTWAFKDCESLQSVYIPNSIEEVGRAAFIGCISLNHVLLPYSEQYAGMDLFSRAAPLSIALYVRKSTSNLKAIHADWWDKLTSVFIENGVTSIEKKGLYNQRNLRTVFIPGSVKSFGQWALYKCDSATIYTTTTQRDDVENAINRYDQSADYKKKWQAYKQEIQRERIKVVPEASFTYFQPFSSYSTPMLVDQIIEWAGQLEGERLNEWRQRVTESSLITAEQQFRDNITNEYKRKRYPSNTTPELEKGDYDPETQYMTFYDKNLGEIIIVVPNDRAEYVDTTWDNKTCKIINCKWRIINDKLQVESLTIVMPNGETFSTK